MTLEFIKENFEQCKPPYQAPFNTGFDYLEVPYRLTRELIIYTNSKENTYLLVRSTGDSHFDPLDEDDYLMEGSLD